MARHNVAELKGALLDFAVAIAEGKHNIPHEWGNAGINDLGRLSIAKNSWDCAKYFEPSKKWADAGPIIEREQIGISPPGSRVHRNGGNQPGWGRSGTWSACTWHAGVDGKRSVAWHETSPLVAAMRCYIRAKFGETVELP